MQKRYRTLETFLHVARARYRKLNRAEFLGHWMFVFVSWQADLPASHYDSD
jgi:hypothetical protein